MDTKKLSKKGVSEVVATVLIIMITILAVSLVAGVIIPMVKEWMAESKECFESRDKLSIESGKFTYYNSTNTLIMIKRASSEFEIKGLMISLTLASGDTKVYQIFSNASLEGVKMYDGSSTLKVPGIGGAKTYVFEVSSDYAQLAPILPSGRACEGISERLEKR